MNEYFSKTEISAVDRTAARTNAVTALSATQSATSRPRNAEAQVHTRSAAPPESDSPGLDEGLAGAAEYARIHARIADILAGMRMDADVTPENAASQIQSMMPTPIIIVPLPPASREAVESAVQLAQRIAEQAHYARAAQAHMQRGTVDQILSAVV